MTFERFDIIGFEAGEYLVLNIITFNNNTYLFLINNEEDKDDASIVKVVENNGVTDFVHIEDDDEYECVANMLLLENKDNIMNNIDFVQE